MLSPGILFALTALVGGAFLIILAIIDAICFNLNPTRFPKYNERAVDSAKIGMVLWLVALISFGFILT